MHQNIGICITCDIPPNDDPFRVETCRDNKEDLVFYWFLPVALTAARTGVYINIFITQIPGFDSH